MEWKSVNWINLAQERDKNRATKGGKNLSSFQKRRELTEELLATQKRKKEKEKGNPALQS